MEPIPCGKYELLQRLGDGGMAEVFKARLPGAAGFERIVVIKRILPHLARRKSAVRMFVAEAKLAAQIHHRNIVQVHELVELESSEFFMVMEYVEGVDLRRLLSVATKGKKRIPPWFSVYALCEVLDGLAYVHELADEHGVLRGVVHRDVSPSNVFISTQGEIKLGDFGVAKDPTQHSETRTGQLKGKVGYMAPEQLRGKEVDARCDVFSVGVVLWECLAQRRLFGGRPDLETMNMICEAARKPPSAYRRDVPDELGALVVRALDVDATKRPASARALQADLLRLLPSLHTTVNALEVRRLVQNLSGRTPASSDIDRIESGTYTNPFGSKTGQTPSSDDQASGPPLTLRPKPDTIMDLSFAGADETVTVDVPGKADDDDDREARGGNDEKPAWLVSGQEMNSYEGDFADMTAQRWRSYRALGGDYGGPLPFWVDDGAGNALGPCDLDVVVATIRGELAIDPSTDLRISADGEDWVAVREFATLTGQDSLLRAIDEPVSATARVVGEISVDSLVKIVYELGKTHPDGQLIVWMQSTRRSARTEIHLDHGKPTYVYTDQADLQLPGLLAVKKITTTKDLPGLFHRVVKERRPLIDLAAEHNQIDTSRFGVVLMKERLADVFRWPGGRVAIDTNAEPRREPPLYASLHRLLPDVVLRGTEIPALGGRLIPVMNNKLRGTNDLRAALDALGFTPSQIEIAERLAKGKKISRLIQVTESQERTIRGVAGLLLEAGVLVQ